MGSNNRKMPKGSGMSGASTNVARGGSGAAGAVSKASRPAGAGAPARRTKPSTGGAMVGNQAGGGILRFYTDDAPGLKIGPVTVLVVSLIYIGCVVLLHIWGKLSR